MQTRDLVRIALFAALTAVLGVFPPITVPAIGVPISAQSLGPMLAGGILGARKGALSMLLLVVLVLTGLPLLSGGRGGLAVLAGPTVGFFLGWIAAAFVVGLVVERSWNRLTLVSAFGAAILGGVVTLYSVGIPGISLITGIPLTAAAASSIAFVPGDLLKAGIAALVILTVKRAYPMIRPAATLR